MSRPVDSVRVACEAGDFDGFSAITITNDLLAPSECVLSIADDDAWRELSRIVAPGREFRVYVNDRLQMSGRAEVNRASGNAQAGTILQLTIRTKLSDAAYSSANVKTRFANTSIRDFIFALFEPFGYLPSDFNFAPATDRDLITGKARGAAAPVDLEPLKAEAAKVNPPETVLEAATRMLKRHHMMLWDAADGRINVGAPDDRQAPTYRFRAKYGADGAGNNVEDFVRIEDWSEVPAEVNVYGGTAGKDVTRASVKGISVDLDLLRVAAESGHFNRRVVIASEGAKTLAQAEAQARRERSARSRVKDGWEFTLDALSYWDGRSNINLAVNTTADVDVDAIGAAGGGRYLVHRVERTLSAEAAATARVQLVAPGVWEI